MKILTFFQIPDEIEGKYTVKLDLKKLRESVGESEAALTSKVKENEVLRKSKLSN